MISGRRYNH